MEISGSSGANLARLPNRSRVFRETLGKLSGPIATGRTLRETFRTGSSRIHTMGHELTIRRAIVFGAE
jgi:hypothetical protein